MLTKQLLNSCIYTQKNMGPTCSIFVPYALGNRIFGSRTSFAFIELLEVKVWVQTNSGPQSKYRGQANKIITRWPQI